MANENNSEVLTPNENATYKVVNGVTYFKLVSEFDGDYTKNCGLLGTEIDENFYFLRGYDIKDVSYDEDTKILTITRVDSDYAPIKLDIGQEIEQEIIEDRPTFDFNKDTGELTITYEDGTTVVVDGFMIQGDETNTIATDNTLRGKGTKYNPLGLAYTERTGTYAPAFDYFDITETGEMPEGMGKGYRVVTKEIFNGFGYLYPYSAVERISEALETTQWRVPTKEDWDELLNAMECEEDRNHSSYTSTYLGKYAGRALKSGGVYEEDEEGNVVQHTGAWQYKPVPPTEDGVFGEDVVGFKALPVGYAENRNSFMNNHDNDVEGFRRATAYWTNTRDEANGQAYGKIFGYATSQVYQQSFDDDSKLSIRLVKDYDLTNYEEYENILGLYYPTKLIRGIHDDLPYAKVWTTVNFYGDKEDLGGVASDEWAGITSGDASVSTVYFICEWDGEKWHKKQMSEGDSVVILNKDGEECYTEWRVIHGELVDTLAQAEAAFAGEIGQLKENVSVISASLETLSSSVITEIGRAIEAEGMLAGEIDILSGSVIELSGSTTVIESATNTNAENITILSGIVEEVSAATAGFDAKIEALSGNVENRINEVQSALTEFSGATVGEINNLKGKDIKGGDYILSGDPETKVILTRENDEEDITLAVSDDFFNFGSIIDE